MPGQRAPGQKQVLTMMDEGFLRDIAAAMRRAGYSDRSKFIRDAIFEKLRKMNIAVDYSAAMAPTRLRIAEDAPEYGAKKKRKSKS